MTAGAIAFTVSPAAAAANPQIAAVSCFNEYVIVGNFGNVDLQMEGWRLWDHGKLHTFVFPSYVLNAGQFVRVWSGGHSGGTIPSLVGWRSAVWNNEGDRGALARPTPGGIYSTRNCFDAGAP